MAEKVQGLIEAADEERAAAEELPDPVSTYGGSLCSARDRVAQV